VAERSFAKEVESLRLGDGDTFRGEGILAVSKGLLQSGVAYVGGYQGAPISHLMDVFADARPILDELGVHFEACGSEAAAAAMLAASINYPIRGAVTWKSTVGTNVASDALSNVSSAGVKGGSLIVIGEDYGEGASIMQERSHAFAMKSQMWLLDPRPQLPKIVEMTEAGFALSEASSTPVMLELRIRACHVYGEFAARDNVAPRYSRHNPLKNHDWDYDRIVLPPATYQQEQDKINRRLPAAIEYVKAHRLNETFDGEMNAVGIILQGGMYNAVIRALQILGLADSFGRAKVPLHVLNVTYPLIEDELVAFCAGKKAVLMVEEGQPDFLEQALNAILKRHDGATRVVGKEVLPMAGEYTGAVVLKGVLDFLQGTLPDGFDAAEAGRRVDERLAPASRAAELLDGAVPPRPPGLCVGCPERPIFSAMKLLRREIGETHISSDIGCNTFATLPPFNMGNTVVGYGLSLAASTGLAPNFGKRVVTVMGDGGFWHNGLTTGVASAAFNRDDGVLLVVDNGYSAATGGQYIPSSEQNLAGAPDRMSIENAVRGLGVTWLKTVYSYDMGRMIRTLRTALTAPGKGLRVIVARGECQLNRQRRVRRENAERLKQGKRVESPRFGVDPDVCTGDHSCIRLSGCPSLTLADNPDPLRSDPVATVDNSCVGCGVCGDVAHAAALCPSFYRLTVVRNPNVWERFVDRYRRRAVAWLRGGREAAPS